MCRPGETKHLAARQTEPSFRAFSPAESLMRVHSMGTGLHNLRPWEIEGCAQKSVYALHCIKSLRTGFSFFLLEGVTLSCRVHSQYWAGLQTHTVGHCGSCCWSHKPGRHAEGAAAVVVTVCKTMLPRAGHLVHKLHSVHHAPTVTVFSHTSIHDAVATLAALNPTRGYFRFMLVGFVLFVWPTEHCWILQVMQVQKTLSVYNSSCLKV